MREGKGRGGRSRTEGNNVAENQSIERHTHEVKRSTGGSNESGNEKEGFAHHFERGDLEDLNTHGEREN